ncbi:Cadherin-22 [Saguinus oedipus]|uniref:Cadherin-22 n=1 Tax=Saguinus oedipus TaxID=9490 RepID=A0ABQ9VLM8_SAGOE|nr:Cadherin-22 [Saguinus oedipus]
MDFPLLKAAWEIWALEDKDLGVADCKEADFLLVPHPGDLRAIHSDSDEGDGAIKYTISGEGAGTIFLIDELTGDIHAMERLDREQKTFYTLRAQARDRATNRLLEPESEFIIKVQDINDSEPRFLHGPYIGSVAELSPTGGLWALGVGVGSR